MMKRYSYSIVFFLLAIGSLVGYYSYVIASAEDGLDMKLETVTGDVSEVEGLSLSAITYYENQKYQLDISADGTDFKPITYIGTDGEENRKLVQLQKDYKDFMRGKGDLDRFYEDAALLAYAEVMIPTAKKPTVNISIYDKFKKEEINFSADLPAEIGDPYDEVRVRDVQLIDQELVLLVSTKGEVMNLHQIKVDIQSEKVSSMRKIFKKRNDEYNYDFIDVKSLTDESRVGASQWFHIGLFYQDGGYNRDSYYLIDASSGDMEKIMIPENLQEGQLEIHYLYETAYIVDETSGMFYAYNRNTKQLETVLAVESFMAPGILSVEMHGDRLYVVTGTFMNQEQYVSDWTVSIFDVKAKEQVYEGRIVVMPEDRGALNSFQIGGFFSNAGFY